MVKAMPEGHLQIKIEHSLINLGITVNAFKYKLHENV